jgi:hypothetical protein
MKLVTAEIKKTLPGPRATENDGDPLARVKFFNPAGVGTWYATEGWNVIREPGGGYREAPLSEYPRTNGETIEDTIFFGWVSLGMGEGELGTFSLREIEAFKGPLGIGIERDLYFRPTKLSEIKGAHA